MGCMGCTTAWAVWAVRPLGLYGLYDRLGCMGCTTAWAVWAVRRLGLYGLYDRLGCMGCTTAWAVRPLSPSIPGRGINSESPDRLWNATTTRFNLYRGVKWARLKTYYAPPSSTLVPPHALIDIKVTTLIFNTVQQNSSTITFACVLCPWKYTKCKRPEETDVTPGLFDCEAKQNRSQHMHLKNGTSCLQLINLLTCYFKAVYSVNCYEELQSIY
jgi:hypothetical protein